MKELEKVAGERSLDMFKISKTKRRGLS